MRTLLLTSCSALALFTQACGYHLAGNNDLLPKTLKTIAVPAFGNATTRYKLTDHLPEAISREFISRTRYRVISDANQADAVVRGTVLTFNSNPTIFDPQNNRASGVEVHLTLQFSLTERATGKTLYNRPNFDVRERYEISIDPAQYFDESDAALDRLCQQVAQKVVSAIVSNF